MDAERQSMIDKVMKLLELGKDGSGAFTAEQEVANNMAAKLMAKHAIDFSDLRSTKKGHVFEHHKVDPLDEIYSAWEATLANVIGKAFDCKVVMSRPRHGTWYLNFLGTKTDLEVSIFFYRHLRRTVGRKAEISFKLKRDREAYCFGMVDTLSERLTDLYQRRQESMDSECRGLVVVKQDGLQDFIGTQFPSLSKGRSRKITGSREAWAKGQSDGRKVGIGRPISNTSQPAKRLS
jgi:hypothetical protein